MTPSDGVTDCPNSDVGMFSEEGLEEIMHDLWNIRGAAFFDALIWNLTDFVESDDFPYDLSGIFLNLVINVKAEKIARQTCDPHHYPMQLRLQSDL